MDEEIPDGEKAKKMRLVSARGEETGVLVTSNTFSTGQFNESVNFRSAIGDDVFSS